MRLLILTCWLLASVVSRAAIVNATNVSQIAVQAAVNASVDGDTVAVPAGEAWWITNVAVFQKAITLQGAGTNLTIIHDEMPNAQRGGSQPSVFKLYNTNLTKIIRLTGFQVVGGVTNRATALAGLISIRTTGNWAPATNTTGATNSTFRIDHMLISDMCGRPVWVYAWNGLIDNNTFAYGTVSDGFAFDGRVLGASDWGDVSWARPIYLGTTNEGVYLEHNRFKSAAASRAATDGFAGARFVARFNDDEAQAFENHGAEAFKRGRSTRWMHIQGNTATNSVGGGERFIFSRGGGGIWESNKTLGFSGGFARAAAYRVASPFANWRIGSGTNIWDNNDPVLYDSGIHNGGNNVTVLVDTTKAWTNNQWAGLYHVINTDNSSLALATPPAAIIFTNGATTIGTYVGVSSGALKWTNGNHYQIRRAVKTLDQVGAGEGDLLLGGKDSPAVDPTPSTWPHQIDQPIWIFNNEGLTNFAPSLQDGGYVIQAGRDYQFFAGPPPGYTMLPDPHPLASGVVLVYPTISQLTNQTIVKNTSTGPLALTIGAGQTNVNNYVMSATSSNPTLITTNTIVFGGSGTSRTVTLTPIVGQFGQSTIAVYVTDETGLQASTVFILFVQDNPGPTPPTISAISPVTAYVQVTSAPSSFTVNDAVTALTNLVVTAVSSDQNVIQDSHLVISGTGGTRAITLDPDMEGTATITVTVRNDASLTASTNFVLTSLGNAVTVGPAPISKRKRPL